MRYYKHPLDVTETERTCAFGVRYRRGAYECKFAADDAVANPLKEALTPQDILAHKWPDPKDFDFSPLADVANAHRDRVIIGGLWTGLMGDSFRLRGFENFLMDTAADFAMAKTLVDKLTDVYMALNDDIFSLLKGSMDIWYFGSDFGMQSGLLVRREVWKELFLPGIRRLTEHAHGYGFKVMMHSCGAISPIIGDVIDAGVDMLDPVQVTAAGMEPETIAAEFGGRMVFHGGIDTQHVLPDGTPGDVAAAVGRLTGAFADTGGYICSPSQIFTVDVPTENILQMYRSAGSLDEDAAGGMG
jgi:uroporphyrinogen decarboxylase